MARERQCECGCLLQLIVPSSELYADRHSFQEVSILKLGTFHFVSVIKVFEAREAVI
jgi:hypothetical protein